MMSSHITKQSGFTLIELVSVMVLMGVLSVLVAPSFFGRDGFAEYAVRDQLIASFRLAQQRAMYDHAGDCYRLNIDANSFGAQRAAAYFGPIGDIGEITLDGDYDGITIRQGTPVPVGQAGPLYFDGLGNVYDTDCTSAAISNPLTLTVQPGGAQVVIYPTGYIRAI